MTSLSDAIDKRLAETAEKERQARQERHEAAQERAEARKARDARWEALSGRERLRLGIVAHYRGADPRDLTNTNKENQNHA